MTIQDILFAFWFMLPAAMANVAPIFTAAIPGLKNLDTPIDGGATLNGKRLLGSHKTWRGIVSGIVFATLILALQQILFLHFTWARYVSYPVDYPNLPTLVFGPLLALGALGGDAVESFFKRRVGIGSGNAWLVFDQIDYILGAIIVTLPIWIFGFMTYVWMVVVWFVIHLVASYIGWLVKLKKSPI